MKKPKFYRKYKFSKYSLTSDLINRQLINQEFVNMISILPLEDIIGVKLECTASIFNNRLFGFPLKHAISNIVWDSVLRYVLSISKTSVEARRIIGSSRSQLFLLCKKFNISDMLNKFNTDQSDQNKPNF